MTGGEVDGREGGVAWRGVGFDEVMRRGGRGTEMITVS